MELYYASDLFVMPVIPVAGDVEGFGIVFLEAALAGTPAVASRIGGIPEAVEDGVSGVLVEPANWDEYIKEIGALVKEKYPDVLVLVDAVSSMAGTEIKVDEWGLDVVLAGTQKAFALPPGLCVVTVSEKAYQRSLSVDNRGFYFNFEQLEKKAVKDQTPATPAISIINALNVQLDRFYKEGIEKRFQRHLDMFITIAQAEAVGDDAGVCLSLFVELLVVSWIRFERVYRRTVALHNFLRPLASIGARVQDDTV